MSSEPTRSPSHSPEATTAAASSVGQSERWGRIATWLSLVGLTIFAFWPLLSFDPRSGVQRATGGIEGVFFEPTGEDPRLIIVLAMWMLFTRRGRIAVAWRDGLGNLPLAAALLSAALGVAAWATWVSAPDLLIQALQLFMMGGATALAGRTGLRAVALPVAFLFLAMPPPAALLNATILPLQLVTVQVCTWLLQSFGVEAYGVGDQLLMRRGIFHVIETCSGIRLMQTLVMAAVVYAELFARRAPRTALLALCAPVVGLLVNFARILSIIFNPYGAVSSVHTTQGLVMVVLGVLALAGLDRMFERIWPAPLRSAGEREPVLARRPDTRLAVVAVALVAIVGATAWGPSWQPSADGPVPIRRLPKQLDGLAANGKTVDRVFLGSVHFSDRIYRSYATSRPAKPAPTGPPPERMQIDLLLGEDDHLNRRGSLLSQKTAYPGRGWQLVGRDEVTLEKGRPQAELLLFQGTGLGRPDDRRMVLHWRDGFAPVAVESARALLGLDRSGFRREERALVWRVSADVSNAADLETVRDELVSFARAAQRAWHQAEANVRPRS